MRRMRRARAVLRMRRHRRRIGRLGRRGPRPLPAHRTPTPPHPTPSATAPTAESSRIGAPLPSPQHLPPGLHHRLPGYFLPLEPPGRGRGRLPAGLPQQPGWVPWGGRGQPGIHACRERAGYGVSSSWRQREQTQGVWLHGTA